MFAALRRSAVADYENCVLMTYIITKKIKVEKTFFDFVIIF